MKKITVQYFAILREERGVSEESVETGAATPAALYEELKVRHRFSLPSERVRAAVNEAFVSNSTLLCAGDRVVFIPPVAGG